MLSFARDIAKAITADDTASLEDDPVTDDTVFTDCDIRIKSAVRCPLLHGGRYKRAGR